jgi:hypothetical protein
MVCLEQLDPQAQWAPQEPLANGVPLVREARKEEEVCPELREPPERPAKLDRPEIPECLGNQENLEDR